MPPQGYCTYPGVVSVLSARYTLAHGITPGVIELEIAPQSQAIAPIGNVVFYYGNTTLTLLGCKADAASVVRGTDGMITSLSLLDRRWRWRFGEVYGNYNDRDQDGRIVGPAATNQDLCYLLLSAMGESADLSAVPGGTYKEVHWAGANPAEELADLLEELGCVLALRPDGSIAIHRVGFGAGLPVNEFLIEAQSDSNPPEIPATIRVLGAPHRFQARLTLEPVAHDRDGAIKHIADLSYKPSDGWERQNSFFAGVTADSDRALALRDVWRLYRIRDVNSPNGAPVVTVPGAGEMRERWEILPLMPGLVETGRDSDGRKKRLPERVMGIYFIRSIGTYNSTTTSNYVYPDRFEIDYEKGLVRFDQQVVKYDTSAKTWVAPELKLECSFNARDRYNGAEYRYSYTLPTNYPYGSGVDVVPQEDIVVEQYEWYADNAANPQWRLKTVEPTADEDGRAAALNRLQSYVTELGASGTYAGLQPFAPDGAIMEVTWSVGATGTFTQVARHAEISAFVPRSKVRRSLERQRAFRRAVLEKQRQFRLAVLERQRRGRK